MQHDRLVLKLTNDSATETYVAERQPNAIRRGVDLSCHTYTEKVTHLNWSMFAPHIDRVR